MDMDRNAQRLARPVYEALPWFYIVSGTAALVVSYLLASRVLSLILGILGLLTLLGGIVVLLRRRGYRELRSQYTNSDSLPGPTSSSADRP